MNQIIPFLLAWYNLPFTLLILLSLILVVMQLVGLGGDGESDHDLDHDADLDHDVDLDHDLEVSHDLDLQHDVDVDHAVDLSHDIDHDIDHDMDHDVDHDLNHEAGGLSGLGVLAYLGVGKVPLMILLLILFSTIGLIGWFLNGLAANLFGRYAGFFFVIVFPVAVASGATITSRTARLFGQLLPPISTTATRAQAFVGKRGTVISPLVDEKYGMVHLRDAGGTLISVFAIARPDLTGAPIKRGEEVLLLSYDPDQKRYLVAHADGLSSGEPRP
jgi:hypothetical protein